MSRPRILFVDDEDNVLKAYCRHFRDLYAVETASCGPAALELIAASEPFAVVVSDYRMPGMTGAEFLLRVRKVSPQTVRMMLSGCADLSAAIAAVNHGNIFRFLSKPCPQDFLARALQASIEQFQLVQAEKQLLEDTLQGSLRVLTEILSLVSPLAFGRATRIRDLSGRLAVRLLPEQRWKVETAAMLSQLGAIALHSETLEKLHRGERLTENETRQLAKQPAIARDLISRIPRLEEIAEIVGRQNDAVVTDSQANTDVALAARILKAVIDFDALEASGRTPAAAIERLRSNCNGCDSDVINALEDLATGSSCTETRLVSATELLDGMCLADDVVTTDGQLLVTRGHQVTQALRHHITRFALEKRIREPISIVL